MATTSFKKALTAFIRGISALEPDATGRHGAALAQLLTCFAQLADPMPPERLLFPPHLLNELARLIVAHGSNSAVAEACCCAIDALLKGEQGRQLVTKHAPLLRWAATSSERGRWLALLDRAASCLYWISLPQKRIPAGGPHQRISKGGPSAAPSPPAAPTTDHWRRCCSARRRPMSTSGPLGGRLRG
jgi:hypothetical protein